MLILRRYFLKVSIVLKKPYSIQEHILDVAYNRITALVDNGIDNLIDSIGNKECS